MRNFLAILLTTLFAAFVFITAATATTPGKEQYPTEPEPTIVNPPGGGHTPVVICHNGREITVDDDGALGGHAGHVASGKDTLGPCPEETTVTPPPEETTISSPPPEETTVIEEPPTTVIEEPPTTIIEEPPTTIIEEPPTTIIEEPPTTVIPPKPPKPNNPNPNNPGPNNPGPDGPRPNEPRPEVPVIVPVTQIINNPAGPDIEIVNLIRTPVGEPILVVRDVDDPETTQRVTVRDADGSGTVEFGEAEEQVLAETTGTLPETGGVPLGLITMAAGILSICLSAVFVLRR